MQHRNTFYNDSEIYNAKNIYLKAVKKILKSKKLKMV